MHYPLATSLSVAVALAQIGEFSFMLSRVGTDLGLLTAEAGNVIVAVAMLSIVLIRFSTASSNRWIGGRSRTRRFAGSWTARILPTPWTPRHRGSTPRTAPSWSVTGQPAGP
jgi:hypothetical protein